MPAGLTAPEAVACSRLYLRRLLDETSAGPRLVCRLQMTPSMRTTGAHDDRTTSAASKRSPRSCTSAVVRPCCCTFCCTELSGRSQGSSIRLPPDQFSSLALASSSRSQVEARTTSRNTRGLRQTVRARPLVSTVVSGDCHSLRHSVAREPVVSGCRTPNAFQVCTVRSEQCLKPVDLPGRARAKEGVPSR